MQVFRELERQLMQHATLHESRSDAWRSRNAELVARFETAAEALNQVLHALAERQPDGLPAALADICPGCQSDRWRREGVFDIACAACGALAVAKPLC